MCGRYALSSSLVELAKAWEVASVKVADEGARYNIAPQQEIAVARTGDGERELVAQKWGLIPAWAKGADIGARLINPRSETVAEKLSFKEAFRHRRCLVPADSFYEWARTQSGKQPFYFKLKSDMPFAFAGLWE